MLEHLHYSPQAQLDLDEIFDYFAVELECQEKGESVVSEILAAAKKIPVRRFFPSTAAGCMRCRWRKRNIIRLPAAFSKHRNGIGGI